MQTNSGGLYRAAMWATFFMAIVAVGLLVAHWRFGILSPKSQKVLGFGACFWLLIAFGYRSDLKAKEAE